MKPDIVVIVGPTGVGKSQAGFELALRTGGEIVSCDAMQVYREVQVACDKPPAEMQSKVRHHLVDVVSVVEEFNAARYRQLAVEAITEILARGRLAIVVGGSGMYIKVLLDGIFEDNARDEQLRQSLVAQAASLGAGRLHERLKGLDPVAASRIHPNDTKRVVRALEVVMVGQAPISQMQKNTDGLWGKYVIEIFGLTKPREVLYQLVEQRVERMFQQGLVQEVQALLRLPLSRTAASMIGIPEVEGYLNGDYDLKRAEYLLKRNTRHYVKRQLTWFRKDKRIQWEHWGQTLAL